MLFSEGSMQRPASRSGESRGESFDGQDNPPSQQLAETNLSQAPAVLSAQPPAFAALSARDSSSWSGNDAAKRAVLQPSSAGGYSASRSKSTIAPTKVVKSALAFGLNGGFNNLPGTMLNGKSPFDLIKNVSSPFDLIPLSLA